jgi:hypothetical protein
MPPIPSSISECSPWKESTPTMPDPGDTGIPALTPRGPIQRNILTAGGAPIEITIARALTRWWCHGCGDHGTDSVVDALIAAAGHGTQCGRGTMLTRMNEAVSEARAELSRVDGKVSSQLTLAVAALTVVLALIGRANLPVGAAAAGWVCVVLIGWAVDRLAGAIRPSLNGHHGFLRYTNADADTIQASFTLDPNDPDKPQRERAEQLGWLSRAVHTKYRRVRLAVDLLRISVVVAVVTVALAGLL